MFLRTNHGKSVQNAAIIELQQDLVDLGVDLTALLNLDFVQLG